MEVSEAAIGILGRLLEARTGQQLGAGRNWRIEAALRPILKARGLHDCDALVGEIVRGHDKRLTGEVIEALVNNETYFFRDHDAFTALIGGHIDRIATAREDRRRMRIWSAACSTGQEPYSIAMMFAEQPERWRGWTIDILGTDISDAAIARAREASYTQFEIQRGLPVARMLRWFTQRGDRWEMDGGLRAMVSLRAHNILEPAPPGYFDLILCRNILLYFPTQTRRAAFDRLADAIDPAGALMLGAGETILGQTDRFEVDPDARGMYRAAARQAMRRALSG